MQEPAHCGLGHEPTKVSAHPDGHQVEAGLQDALDG